MFAQYNLGFSEILYIYIQVQTIQYLYKLGNYTIFSEKDKNCLLYDKFY